MSKRSIEIIKKVADYCANNGGYDSVLKAVRITDGGNGHCTAEFKISKEHLNLYGGLHGGCAAAIIDNITTYALMSADSHPGVSVDLYVSYLKTAKEGEEIIVDAQTVKVGRKTALIDCVLKKKSDGSIVVKGSQTKFIDFDVDEFYNKYNFH